ncbi:alkaline phosphatase family protein [Paenibacillus sp. UNC451MF]|uniref:alkaline phosphatase family protein n=1 Tax=Paenibacillus sp. UNC451MF TaxID=1449063 RepID=UPI00048F1FD3|nr:alkaline phosphatase family protein [Paenibacillus sp. UNC451MF]
MRSMLRRIVIFLLMGGLVVSSWCSWIGGGVASAFAASTSSMGSNKVVHITWDGFYSELYDLAKKSGKATPNLDKLVANGIRLTNHKTTVPSAVAGHFATMTGAFPKTTGNTYKYLDGTNVINFSTALNEAQTITKAMQNSRTAVVINEYAVKAESAPTFEYYSTSSVETVTFAGTVTKAVYQIENYGQPDYLNLYSNDLYMEDREITSEKADYEAHLLTKLTELDAQLGTLMKKIETKGNPAKTTYILSSHSGVTQTKGKKATALLNALSVAPNGFTYKEVSTGAVAGTPDMVTIKNYEATYLQLFIYNKTTMTQERIDQLIRAIQAQDYVLEVMNRNQLDALGVHPKFADLLVIPKEGYTFSPASEKVHRPDSFDSTSTHVFGVISGSAVPAKGDVRVPTSITDLSPTVAALLGIPAPANAEGINLLKVRVEKPTDNHVLYINLDGFAYKWYELANSAPYRGTPNLNALIQDGVLFTNASTGIPSITDAMQQAVVSGAWPVDTGNDYRHYDSSANVVVQYSRENALENIAEAVYKNNIGLAAVNAFYFENKGAVAGNAAQPYVTASGLNSSKERADEMVKVILGEPFQSGGKTITLTEVPHFLAFYADDIDAVGHNNHTEAGGAYGVPVATDVQTYLDNVAKTVIRVDEQLGRIIQALKDRGIYNKTTIALTTDHGMVQFGADNAEFQAPYLPGTYTSLADLEQTIAGVGQKFRGSNYKVETVFAKDTSAKPDTEIVITTVGLQAQIKFRIPVEKAVLDEIVEQVKGKVYYGAHMLKEDLIKRGATAHFADLLISPKPPYHFKTGDPSVTKQRSVAGQHDSLDEDAQHIFTLLAGAHVEKGMEYTKKMYNIDIAPTIARVLGIEGPAGATGAVLDEALDEAYRGPGLKLTAPASDDTIVDTESITITGLTDPLATIKVNGKWAGAADVQGTFSITQSLTPGIHRVIVEAAVDTYTTRQVVYVTYKVPRMLLLQKIAEGRALYETSVEGADVGNYKPGSKAVFKQALSDAVIVSENIEATASQLQTGLSQLEAAYANFRAAERSPAAGYHLFGEVLLPKGTNKAATTITVESVDRTVRYETGYGQTQGNTQVGKVEMTDSKDSFGTVLDHQVQYYADVPQGTYNITIANGAMLSTFTVITSSATRGELPWGVYYVQRISDTTLAGAVEEAAPAVPSGFSASAENGKVTLSWNANKEPDIAEYRIYMDGGASASYTTTEQSHTVTGLMNGQTYRFQLSAVNRAGMESAKTAEVKAAPYVMYISSGSRGGGGGSSVSAPVVETPSVTTPSQQPEVMTLDEQQLIPSIDNGDRTIEVQLNDTNGAAALEIAGRTLLKAAAKAPDAVVVAKSSSAAFHFPVKLLQLPELAQRLGTDTEHIKVRITVELVAEPITEQLRQKLKELSAVPLSDGVEFHLSVIADNGKEELIDNFDGAYVARTMMINGYVDPSRASAVWFDPATGSIAFVPSVFYPKNGKTEVVMKRTGNSVYTIASAQKSFKDLSQHWAKTDVELLASKQLVQGVSDSRFDPDSRVTRAQFAALLVRALGLNEVSSGSKFTDVREGEWFAGSVKAAAKAGLVSGFQDGSYHPEEPITREESAVMISKALRIAGNLDAAAVKQEQTIHEFKDQSQISLWAQEAVKQSASAGIITGMDDDAFGPSEYTTRAQAAVMLKRLLQHVQFIN